MSKKKKNTYIISTQVFMDASLFAGCKNTPLMVTELNGKKINNQGWVPCTEFPNPGASNMVQLYDVLHPVMGKRLAGTIVEYLDKETSEPVAMLFPTNEIMCRAGIPDFLTRLNHASRQDLNHQMLVREKYLNMLKSKQK